MIEIQLDDPPFYGLSFLNAKPSGKEGHYTETLPFMRGTIKGLPEGSPPLVLTADLQGRIGYGSEDDSLLGCHVPDAFYDIEDIYQLPQPECCLALLAGDFYTFPTANKRGGDGPVDAIWETMEDCFIAALGVAGNHDTFNRKPSGLLDGDSQVVGPLRVAGVSGIIGSRNKLNRRDATAYADQLANALSNEPHILLLHSAPHVDAENPGSEELREMLKEFRFTGLLVCGHVHWQQRVQRIDGYTCLNVHESVVILDPT